MSFPHYPQFDEMDCGPSCLRMIAKYYGKSYTLDSLRGRCFITREGVSMLGISDAAEDIGFRTIGARISFEQLVKEANLPCILHWNKNHFVVCYKIKKYKDGKTDLYIADPASRKLVYHKDEFLKCWISQEENLTGTVLLLEPGPMFADIVDESQSSRRNLIFFTKYLIPYKRQFAQLIIGMIIGSGIQMIFPFLTQALVDIGIRDRNLGFITLILVSQLMLFVSQISVSFIRSWILLHINSRVDIALISDFLMKLMSLSLRYFDTKMTGDIMQRIGDHARIKSFLMGSSVNIVFSFFSFIVFGTILGYYDLWILVIFLLGNTLYVIWILAFMKYRRILDVKRFNLSAGEQSKIIQLIQGMQEIKLNNCERQKRWEWERIQVKLFKILIKGLAISQIQQFGSIFFHTKYKHHNFICSSKGCCRWSHDSWYDDVPYVYTGTGLSTYW